MEPFIIAHRGASALAEHENTLEAFEIAISLGCEYAEFDIRRTADDKLIVFHDSAIEGTAISELSYDRLCSITYAQGYRVPLLKEVLSLCAGRIKLDIELKETGYEKRVIRLVKKYFDYDEFQIKSFLDIAAARVKRIDPQITTGLLVGVKHANIKRRANEFFPIRRLHACKADFISPYFRLATKGFIKRMHCHRIPVFVWTVNKEKIMLRCIANGADGIISDRPDTALSIRREITKYEKVQDRFYRLRKHGKCHHQGAHRECGCHTGEDLCVRHFKGCHCKGC